MKQQFPFIFINRKPHPTSVLNTKLWVYDHKYHTTRCKTVLLLAHLLLLNCKWNTFFLLFTICKFTILFMFLVDAIITFLLFSYLKFLFKFKNTRLLFVFKVICICMFMACVCVCSSCVHFNLIT